MVACRDPDCELFSGALKGRPQEHRHVVAFTGRPLNLHTPQLSQPVCGDWHRNALTGYLWRHCGMVLIPPATCLTAKWFRGFPALLKMVEVRGIEPLSSTLSPSVSTSLSGCEPATRANRNSPPPPSLRRWVPFLTPS